MFCQKSAPQSNGDRFQVFGVHLDRGVLIDQLERQHKPQTIAFSHQSPLKTLHDTAFDADFFPENEIAIRLDPVTASARA
jgi:hypothetical protein